MKELQTIQDKLQTALDKPAPVSQSDDITKEIKTLKDDLFSIKVSLSMMEATQSSLQTPQEEDPWWWKYRTDILLIVVMLLILLLSHRITTLSDQIADNKGWYQRILWNVTYPDDRLQLTDPLNDIWNNQIKYEMEQKKGTE